MEKEGNARRTNYYFTDVNEHRKSVILRIGFLEYTPEFFIDHKTLVDHLPRENVF